MSRQFAIKPTNQPDGEEYIDQVVRGSVETMHIVSGLSATVARQELRRMTATSQQLQEWLNAKENEHLEFKEAKNRFDFDKLVKYCASLANEGGGSIVLGVTDKLPRRVVGSAAFVELERTKAGLIDRLRLRIEAKRSLTPTAGYLSSPRRRGPIGVPVAVEGAYWMRAGEDLAPMTPDMLRRIFDEAVPDYSAEICRNATLADLDPAAIESLRSRWARHSGNKSSGETAGG